MIPVAEMSARAQRPVRALFTDIDDTLTLHGKLGAAAYEALWRLKEAEVLVLPITGRPAGWCDLIARQWPVDGVIGENGAFAFFEREGQLHRILHPEVAKEGFREKLNLIQKAVLERVPGSRVARDQLYREYDLAIDFAEDEPRLDLEVAERIREVFESFGARAKVSSIHVNGWYGNYDKLAMAKIYAQRRWGIDLEAERGSCFFCGDSPNDEAMFDFFPLSCAVANIAPFIDRLKSTPAYVSQAPGGEGFREIVDVLLEP